MSRQIILHKQMKVRRVIYLMMDKTNIGEFVTKFKEEFPDDYNNIVNRYESHSEKSDKHPMPKPDVYLKNMYKKEFWKYMEIIKSEGLKGGSFEAYTQNTITELFNLDKTFPFNVIKALNGEYYKVSVDIYNVNLNDFHKVFMTLSTRERNVLKLRFKENLSLNDVGVVIGVGVERTRQLQNIALNKLRNEVHEFARRTWGI